MRQEETATMAEMEHQEYDWHSKTVEEVEQLQETSISQGLTSAEAKKRLEAYGLNELPPPKTTPFYLKLWAQLNNILIFILIVAAIVLGVLEEFAEVGLICAVVIINVSIGLVQEGKAEAAADAIKGMLAGKATVIRDGAAGVIMAVRFLLPSLCSPRSAPLVLHMKQCMTVFSAIHGHLHQPWRSRRSAYCV